MPDKSNKKKRNRSSPDKPIDTEKKLKLPRLKTPPADKVSSRTNSARIAKKK